MTDDDETSAFDEEAVTNVDDKTDLCPRCSGNLILVSVDGDFETWKCLACAYGRRKLATALP